MNDSHSSPPANQASRPPARVLRARRGRWVAGVCAGLPHVRGLGTGWIRLAFVLGAICGGLGVVVYFACWLVIPSEGEPAQAETDPTGGVVFAWAIAGAVGLAVLGLVGATATAFGVGWAVLGVAAATLAAAWLGRLRIGSAWTLLALAALTVPAVAIALSPVRLTLESGAPVAVPASAQRVAASTYRSGFGTLLIDLRHTQLPASGTVPLRIRAGVRRTIVALPANRCVRVALHYAVHPFARQLAALLSGRSSIAAYGVVFFGQWYGTGAPNGRRGVLYGPSRLPGPTLEISFVSQGGSLYVRDYPGDVSPSTSPNWPGFHVTPEPRPLLSNESKRLRAGIVRSWQMRRRVELASARTINPLLPGPCDPPR